jgi:peptidoglycan/xylan/chitin deacetylase (PgdA/CDA1 family)
MGRTKAILAAASLCVVLWSGLGWRARNPPRPGEGVPGVQNGWGEHGAGIEDKIPGESVYLTLDACDGRANGFDAELIGFLLSENIPATVFLTRRWIDKNPVGFSILASSPLFRIENHGAGHRPASTSGKSAYGMRGTGSEGELSDEINGAADRIAELSGRRPKWYRSGGAHYDDGAVGVVRDLGYRIAGFAISLDAGASLPAGEVYRNAMRARPGDILLAHMNRPEKDTFEGLKPALLELRAAGYSFALLPE